MAESRKVAHDEEKKRKKYLLVIVSGGLNQQRNEIVDSVVIARILGAILVVPILQVNQIWKDPRSAIKSPSLCVPFICYIPSSRGFNRVLLRLHCEEIRVRSRDDHPCRMYF
jgi:hypothetical protein